MGLTATSDKGRENITDYRQNEEEITDNRQRPKILTVNRQCNEILTANRHIKSREYLSKSPNIYSTKFKSKLP